MPSIRTCSPHPPVPEADVMTSSEQAGPTPLAQNYDVIFEVPDPRCYTPAASLVRLPDGALLSSFALMTRVDLTPGVPDREAETIFRVSGDDGRTWQTRSTLPVGDGLLFVHDGRVHLLGNREGRRDLVLSTSEDGARTWSAPVTLFEGRFWNTFTPHAVRDRTLYWAVGAPNENGNFNRSGSRIAAIAGDLGSDLTDPRGWRLSELLTYPGTPAGMSAGLTTPAVDDGGDHWLEPNVVNVDGRVRAVVRLRVDGQTTSHLCAMCDVDDDGRDLALRFTQFHPIPGNCYFHIIRDGPAGYYWTTTNLPTRTQQLDWGRGTPERCMLGGSGNERRFLMLNYSADALNWFPAGCVARWPHLHQGLQYNALLVDGDDLLISSRTSKDRPNQHDNDLVTLHRVGNFRALAMDLGAADG